MNSFFDNPTAFAPFEEDVVVVCKDVDTAAVVRKTTIRASVMVGRGMTDSAGGPVNAESAGDATVSIVASAWPFRFPPRFGMSIETALDRLTVKSSDRTEWGWNLVCTFDERVADR